MNIMFRKKQDFPIGILTSESNPALLLMNKRKYLKGIGKTTKKRPLYQAANINFVGNS